MIYKREGINSKKPEKVIREKNLNAPIEKKKPKQTKILSHPLYILVCQFNESFPLVSFTKFVLLTSKLES